MRESKIDLSSMNIVVSLFQNDCLIALLFCASSGAMIGLDTFIHLYDPLNVHVLINDLFRGKENVPRRKHGVSTMGLLMFLLTYEPPGIMEMSKIKQCC